jgi:RNA polymerase sigma-70 factor (ECF subfamily)
VSISETTTVTEADDLETLYRHHGARLWRVMVGVTHGRRQVAEDAIAEAFARALEHREAIREPLPWIYRTAVRVARNELQREQKWRAEANEDMRKSAAPDSEGLQDLFRALAHLSPNQRAAIILHFEEGLTVPEVSKLLGISQSTVRVHIHRGRRRLQALLSVEEASDV